MFVLKGAVTESVVVNEWLSGYTVPSGSGGRDVVIPSIYANSWSTYGGRGGINALVGKGLDVTEQSNGAVVNGSGRHWIAAGPRVLNPNYPDNGKLWWGYDGLTLSTKVDIVIKNKSSNELCYVYVIVGDLRGHTYNPGQPGHGVRQSGIPYPNSSNASQGIGDSDNSTVEFYRTRPSGESQSVLNAQWEIVKMIVY